MKIFTIPQLNQHGISEDEFLFSDNLPDAWDKAIVYLPEEIEDVEGNAGDIIITNDECSIVEYSTRNHRNNYTET